MNTIELKKRVNDVINANIENPEFRHCIVRIDGKIEKFDELHFRALQVAVAKMNDEDYEDFCKNVKIFNGPNVHSSDDTITILRDGRVDKPFKSGFLDATDNLVMTLLRMKAVLH